PRSDTARPASRTTRGAARRARRAPFLRGARAPRPHRATPPLRPCHPGSSIGRAPAPFRAGSGGPARRSGSRLRRPPSAAPRDHRSEVAVFCGRATLAAMIPLEEDWQRTLDAIARGRGWPTSADPKLGALVRALSDAYNEAPAARAERDRVAGSASAIA